MALGLESAGYRLCLTCGAQPVCEKEVDRSKTANRYMNQKDKLTSTTSWPIV
jgi:hypothetical protein